MKNLNMIRNLLFFLALLPMSIFAQDAPKVSHTEVVEVAGASAKTLTDRANTFMTLKRIEAKTVGNVVSGIGSLTVSYQSIKFGVDKGFVKFDMKIMLKDGKYKIDLSDFKHEGMHGKSSGGSIDLEKPECGDAQIYPAAWATIKSQTQEQLKIFLLELKKKMANPVKTVAPSTTDF